MGEWKYLKNGQKVNVVNIIDTGYLVQDVYTNDYDEDPELFYDDRIYFVEKVYEHTPTKSWDEKIGKLDAQIREKENELLELDRKIRETQTVDLTRLKRYKQYEQLKRLDDYLDGKITHFVVLEYSFYILTLEEVAKKDDNRLNKVRLLSLFGDSNGNLEWNLNQCIYGTGNWEAVIPCCSMEEALTELQNYVDKNAKKDGWAGRRCAEAAKRYGLKIDPSVVQSVKDRDEKDIKGKIDSLEKELNNKREELKKLQEEGV